MEIGVVTMLIKKGSILYARVDSKVEGKELSKQDFQDHLNYVENIAKERYLLGGGFSNIDGGMLLYEAINIEEAQKVAQSDPIIERGIYQCDVYEWKLVILSENSTL